jgi:GTP-binding protein EngB required for normal cell division
MSVSRDPLLRRLAELTCDPAVTALQARRAGRRFRILVAGEAKRGKSTLVNALIAAPLLPTGVTPVTALPVTVCYSSSPRLIVTFHNRRVESRPVSDLAVLATENGNPDNRLGITDLTLTTAAPLLRGHVELVDTPGVATIYQQSSAAAAAALDTMDAAILVLTADPPISASERDLLHQLRDKSMAVFCVLNKADRLDPAELADVIAYTGTVVSGALGNPVTIYPCTARAAFDPDPETAGRSGVGALTSALRAYLAERRDDDLDASISGHAARLCARYLDTALLTRRAAVTSSAADDDRIALFASRIGQADRWRADAADLARAEQQRMLHELNTAAAQAGPQLAAQAADQAAALLDTADPHLSTAAAEDWARTATTTLIARLADAWRDTQQTRLKEALHRLDQRLTADLDAHLADLRAAARELIGVELMLPAPAADLLPATTISYALGGDIGITVAWEATIRRHLPGRYGLRRVRDHLAGEARTLTDRQIGRVRAAFQQSLRETGPRVTARINARYTAVTADLRAALSAARDIATAPDRAARLADLDQRVHDLQTLHEQLRAAATGSSQPAADPAGR